MGYDKSYQAVRSALLNLKLEYIDSMLIHWPGVKGKPLSSHIHRKFRYETFRGLLKGNLRKSKSWFYLLIL